jgi:hypothetical protein
VSNKERLPTPPAMFYYPIRKKAVEFIEIFVAARVKLGY